MDISKKEISKKKSIGENAQKGSLRLCFKGGQIPSSPPNFGSDRPNRILFSSICSNLFPHMEVSLPAASQAQEVLEPGLPTDLKKTSWLCDLNSWPFSWHRAKPLPRLTVVDSSARIYEELYCCCWITPEGPLAQHPTPAVPPPRPTRCCQCQETTLRGQHAHPH